MMAKQNRPKRWRKIILFSLLGLALLTGVGFGYRAWSQTQTGSSQATAEAVNTATVRRGSLTLSASGSGSLSAGKTVELGFPIAGVVAEMNAVPGEPVDTGQELARLEDITALQIALTAAELDLKEAQKALTDLKDDASSSLATARLALAEAKKAHVDAQAALKTADVTRCDQDTINAKYTLFIRAQEQLESLGDGGGSQDYYLTAILPAKNDAASAYSAYMYCAGYTDYEIEASQANLTLTRTAMEKAQATYAALVENNGVDPDALTTAENAVTGAQIAYDSALSSLEKAVLKAPFDATVIRVEAGVGDEVGTGAVITLADLLHPRVEFSVDETDMDKVEVGKAAEVTFDALPDQTFKGTVIQVNPALESLSGYQVLSGVIELNVDETQAGTRFLEGLSASVEIIGGEAENALLVPVEAVRDLEDGTYGVFVVESNGTIRLHPVEVGLMDATYVEIKSGLNLGDKVTTGLAETQS